MICHVERGEQSRAKERRGEKRGGEEAELSNWNCPVGSSVGILDYSQVVVCPVFSKRATTSGRCSHDSHLLSKILRCLSQALNYVIEFSCSWSCCCTPSPPLHLVKYNEHRNFLKIPDYFFSTWRYCLEEMSTLRRVACSSSLRNQSRKPEPPLLLIPCFLYIHLLLWNVKWSLFVNKYSKSSWR